MPEDNNQQPNNSSTDNNQANPVQPQVRTGGQKVIQPSPELLQELRAQQQQQAAQPISQPVAHMDASSTVQAATQLTSNPQSTQSAATLVPNSIYPEATHGIGAGNGYPMPNSATMQTNVPAENNKTKLIVTAVMAFGALMVVVSALSLISWIRVSGLGGANSSSSILGILLAAGELILGIGIIMRRETARAIYVVLALILLVFSLYGTYNYFNAVSKFNKSEQAYITRTQQEITQYQNNRSLSGSEKARIIKTLQDGEQRQKQQLSKNKSTLLPILESYAISVLPLVFLTRPSVKEIFD